MLFFVYNILLYSFICKEDVYIGILKAQQQKMAI